MAKAAFDTSSSSAVRRATTRKLTDFANWAPPAGIVQMTLYWTAHRDMAEALMALANQPRFEERGLDKAMDAWISGLLGRCDNLVEAVRVAVPANTEELEAQTNLLLRHESHCGVEDPLALVEIANNFMLRTASLKASAPGG